MTTYQEAQNQRAKEAEQLAAAAMDRLARARKYFTLPKWKTPLLDEPTLEDEMNHIRRTVAQLDNGD